MTGYGTTARLAFLMSGLLVWALHFIVAYAFNALACARGFAGQDWWGVPLVPLVLVAVTVIAILAEAAILGLAVAGRGPGIAGEPDGSVKVFWRFTTASVAVLGLIAVLWTGLPVVLVRTCGEGREIPSPVGVVLEHPARPPR